MAYAGNPYTEGSHTSVPLTQDDFDSYTKEELISMMFTTEPSPSSQPDGITPSPTSTHPGQPLSDVKSAQSSDQARVYSTPNHCGQYDADVVLEQPFYNAQQFYSAQPSPTSQACFIARPDSGFQPTSDDYYMMSLSELPPILASGENSHLTAPCAAAPFGPDHHASAVPWVEADFCLSAQQPLSSEDSLPVGRAPDHSLFAGSFESSQPREAQQGTSASTDTDTEEHQQESKVSRPVAHNNRRVGGSCWNLEEQYELLRLGNLYSVHKTQKTQMTTGASIDFKKVAADLQMFNKRERPRTYLACRKRFYDSRKKLLGIPKKDYKAGRLGRGQGTRSRKARNHAAARQEEVSPEADDSEAEMVQQAEPFKLSKDAATRHGDTGAQSSSGFVNAFTLHPHDTSFHGVDNAWTSGGVPAVGAWEAQSYLSSSQGGALETLPNGQQDQGLSHYNHWGPQGVRNEDFAFEQFSLQEQARSASSSNSEAMSTSETAAGTENFSSQSSMQSSPYSQNVQGHIMSSPITPTTIKTGSSCQNFNVPELPNQSFEDLYYGLEER